MVSDAVLSEQAASIPRLNYEDKSECDAESVVSSSEDESEGAVVLSQAEENKSPCFQNIEVTNSTDVHFGNKTYYQGPVTIKQILYASPNADGVNGGIENLAIKDKCVIDKIYGKDTEEFVTDSVSVVSQTNGYVKNNNDKNSVPAGVSQGTKWLKHFSRKRYILVCSMAIVLLVALCTLATILITKHMPNLPHIPVDSSEADKGVPEPEPDDPNVNVTLSGKLKIIPRRTWLAQPPTEEPHKISFPVPYVIIMHTASDQCKDQADCIFAVRHIQAFHIESNGWWDIGYNFLIGGDGFAYEGRGWKVEGAHTYGYNSRSVGIAFIGTYNTVLPTQAQMTACKQLIEQGVENGSIAKNYKLLAARQVSSTKSPGLALYEEIKKWPHWSASP